MIGFSSQRLYPRKIVGKINKFLNSEELIVLVGARQVGKTCILQLLREELIKKGVEEKSIYYFDLEDLSILKILNNGVDEFLRYLESLGADLSKKQFVFIDEIQYLDNPSNFLKLLSDHNKNIKLIVSGSSTFEIKKKFKDSLAGRKVLFEIYSLDFSEFLIFKEENVLYELLLKNSFEKIRSEGVEPDFSALKFHSENFKRLLEEFLVFGGYPRVVLESDHEKKITYLMEIYNTYVKKDIKDLMRIDNIMAFNDLIKTLSLQIGNLLNYYDISVNLRIARNTFERYIFILQNTFVISIVPPYFTNKRKEIVKMPKIYFLDNGLRNIATKNFTGLDERTDAGALVKNHALTQILKNLKQIEEIRFWRTQSKNEVDFIISGQNPIPIEIKYRFFKIPVVPRGMKYFLKNYPSPYGFVLTKDFFGKVVEGKTCMYFLPVWVLE